MADTTFTTDVTVIEADWLNDVNDATYPLLHKVTIDIGDWNMDTTTFVSVSHTLDITKVRQINAVIRNDAGTNTSDINVLNGSETSTSGVFIISSGVQLYRGTGGAFDSSVYSSTGYNRGWITIQYVD